MFRLILIVVVFMNIVFSQELTKEQEFYYNKNKISIEKKPLIFGITGVQVKQNISYPRVTII